MGQIVLVRHVEGDPDERQFQAWFERATARWLSGEHDSDYRQSWSVFRDWVLGALDRIGDGTTGVVTSGGPVAVVVFARRPPHLPLSCRGRRDGGRSSPARHQ